MARPQTERLLARILELMGERAYRQIKPLIGSSTLRDALELIVEVPENQARLYIPHYWAVYYHDGRRGFGPKSAPFLIFFADPANDPRFPGRQTPERADQIRRLTRAEYYTGLERNRQRAKAGRRPFMYVIRDPSNPRRPGRVGPQQGTFFFEEGGAGLAKEFSSPEGEVAQEFNRYVQDMIDDELLDKRTGTINI